MENLNGVDIGILIFFGISIVAGFMRGLVRELLSLLTWVAAFIVAICFSGRLAAVFTNSEMVHSAVSSAGSSMGMDPSQSVSMLAIGISFMGLFILTLFIGSLVNYFLSSLAELQGVSFINRSLGGAFGFLRGCLIVLVTIFLVQMTPASRQDYWMQSQLVPVFQPGVVWVNNIVQPGVESVKSKLSDSLRNVNPGQYIDQIKDNFSKSGASGFFQK